MRCGFILKMRTSNSRQQADLMVLKFDSQGNARADAASRLIDPLSSPSSPPTHQTQRLLRGEILLRIAAMPPRIGAVHLRIGVMHLRIGVIRPRIGVMRPRIGVMRPRIAVIRPRTGGSGSPKVLINNDMRKHHVRFSKRPGTFSGAREYN